MTYTDNRRDSNEAELVAFWRAAGCLWIPMNRLAGFDGLLVVPTKIGSGLFIVEVKRPGHANLTQAERELRDKVEDMGGCYNVVQTVQDAARLIGLEVSE